MHSSDTVAARDGVETLTVRRWRDGRWEEADDSVAAEVPVALTYHSIPHVVMLATPRDLADLGLGFTVSEALVENAGEVREVNAVQSDGALEVRISVEGSRLGAMLERRRNLTGRTGCGVC